MNDCISSLYTLLNTRKDDIRGWCLYSYLVHVLNPCSVDEISPANFQRESVIRRRGKWAADPAWVTCILAPGWGCEIFGGCRTLGNVNVRHRRNFHRKKTSLLWYGWGWTQIIEEDYTEENPVSNLFVYSTLIPKFLCPFNLSYLSCGV
jgi:hypothetical protein